MYLWIGQQSNDCNPSFEDRGGNFPLSVRFHGTSLRLHTQMASPAFLRVAKCGICVRDSPDKCAPPQPVASFLHPSDGPHVGDPSESLAERTSCLGESKGWAEHTPSRRKEEVVRVLVFSASKENLEVALRER